MAAVSLSLMLTPIAASAAHRPVSAGDNSARHPAQAGQAVRRAPAETCPDARRGLSWYRARARSWAHKMGAAASGDDRGDRPVRSCPQIRRAVKFWRAKAATNRRRYERWAHDYAWWLWLPDKFRRVGHCETGSTAGGTAAGNWRWDSGRYVSAFGIYRPAYEAYHRWTGQNSPREQYEVAAAIQSRFGWGAWGCGDA